MFYIDNISSEKIGVIALENTFLARAPILYEEKQIDGLDGSIFDEKAYGNVSDTLELTLLDDSKLDYAKSIFLGTKTLRFDGKETMIHFYDSIAITRSGAKKILSIPFIRNPFWYLRCDSFIKVIDILINIGNIKSKPIIKIIGSGVVTIKINDISFEYEFDADGKVIIDCEKKAEYFNGNSKSRNLKIGFEYPFLNPGINSVSIIGNCELFVKRKDCFL